MRSESSRPLSLGDVVVAAFDAAAVVTDDQRAKSWLATCAVRRLLVKAGRLDLARRLDG